MVALPVPITRVRRPLSSVLCRHSRNLDSLALAGQGPAGLAGFGPGAPASRTHSRMSSCGSFDRLHSCRTHSSLHFKHTSGRGVICSCDYLTRTTHWFIYQQSLFKAFPDAIFLMVGHSRNHSRSPIHADDAQLLSCHESLTTWKLEENYTNHHDYEPSIILRRGKDISTHKVGLLEVSEMNGILSESFASQIKSEDNPKASRSSCLQRPYNP